MNPQLKPEDVEATQWMFYHDGDYGPATENELRDFGRRLRFFSCEKGIASVVMEQMWVEIDRLRVVIDVYGKLPAAPETIEEVDRLRRDCSEYYHIIAALGDAVGLWDSELLVKALDNAQASAEGNPRPHADLLPFIVPKPEITEADVLRCAARYNAAYGACEGHPNKRHADATRACLEAFLAPPSVPDLRIAVVVTALLGSKFNSDPEGVARDVLAALDGAGGPG